MKKVISLLIAVVMITAVLPLAAVAVSGRIEATDGLRIFTWAWDAKTIDTDNVAKVVSWKSSSGTKSFRSSFIVYDLPEDFTYTSVKSEVFLTFCTLSAYLDNGTGQAPTAAVVLVNGDKVKEAYSLKSGAVASNLLTEAKNNGIFVKNYKIGQYPRASRIRDAVITEYFEKNPGVKSVGIYFTNLESDGYDTVGGIATAMTEFEFVVEAVHNYTNLLLEMVDEEGNILDTVTVRDEIGTVVNYSDYAPDTIEKDGILWVRDENASFILAEVMETVTVTYHNDIGDREKYVETIENMIAQALANPLDEDVDLPQEYVSDDGFVIDIEWFTTDDSVIDASGKVYPGTTSQTAQLYARIWIGEYTYVETEKYTVTVLPVDTKAVEAEKVFFLEFEGEEYNRGNFENEGISVECNLQGEYTIALYVRCDDISSGGTVFNVGGAECKINSDGTVSVGTVISATKLREGEWYHIALTSQALYINGEKETAVESIIPSGDGYVGEFCGKADNFEIYSKAFSGSVVNYLMEKGYDSPPLEVISASVAKGLDSVVVRLSSNGYEGEAVVSSYADLDEIRHAGYSACEMTKGLNVICVSIPNMCADATEDNVTVLVWGGFDNMTPLLDEYKADRSYDFGFDYKHPDNHMLNNTFTLVECDTGRYLTSTGISQRADNALWNALYRSGINTDGYYSLVNKNGAVKNGNWTFIQVNPDMVEGKRNVYLIKNKDTGKYLSVIGSSVDERDEGSCWELSITEYDAVSRAFASEGFVNLSATERESLYSVSAQAMKESSTRRDKLKELVSGEYFTLDGYAQAERLRELFAYYPSYQINRAVNKSTTGVEATYTLSDITWTTYEDMDGNSKSGYTAMATYTYNEGDVTVAIYARSQNVVRNIAKGFSYMPYQFIKPLKTVIDYNASNNQFKAEQGLIYIETNYEVSADNVAVIGAHELGHLIDFAGFRMSMGDYKTARENECSVSGYGNTALNEDFAEFCQFVISCSGDREQLRQVREMFPGRYDAVCDGMCEMYGECMMKSVR